MIYIAVHVDCQAVGVTLPLLLHLLGFHFPAMRFTLPPSVFFGNDNAKQNNCVEDLRILV